MQTVLHTVIPHQIRTSQRLLYIDNIRWLMIIFVVLVHLNCTYGNIGRWFYQEAGPGDAFSMLFFGMFASLTQAYFMGLLFFIAGFFVPGSYDKKGSGRFMRDRLIRLGIPTLIFMVFLKPLILFMLSAFNRNLPSDPFSWYQAYLFSSDFISGSGPLWFALALLIFSAIYGLVRLVGPKSKSAPENGPPALITHSRVIGVIALISLSAFSIRLIQPIGTAFFNMQLSFFSQYVILFSLGIVAYRRNLLANLSVELGRFWFQLALGLGIPLWGLLIILGGAFQDWTPFCGGFHWQAAAYAIWESFFCIGMSLGLLVLFRERYNVQGRLSRFLSENAFGVYVFHAPLLVGASMLFRGIVIYPLLKMILMAVMMLPVCFGFSYLIRKVPPLKRIFF